MCCEAFKLHWIPSTQFWSRAFLAVCFQLVSGHLKVVDIAASVMCCMMKLRPSVTRGIFTISQLISVVNDALWWDKCVLLDPERALPCHWGWQGPWVSAWGSVRASDSCHELVRKCHRAGDHWAGAHTLHMQVPDFNPSCHLPHGPREIFACGSDTEWVGVAP